MASCLTRRIRLAQPARVGMAEAHRGELQCLNICQFILSSQKIFMGHAEVLRRVGYSADEQELENVNLLGYLNLAFLRMPQEIVCTPWGLGGQWEAIFLKSSINRFFFIEVLQCNSSNQQHELGARWATCKSQEGRGMSW